MRILFDEDIRETEYFEVETLAETFLVTQATALELERALDRVPAPVWIEFRDLFGERHRVIIWHVLRVIQATPARREAWRALQRARMREYE